MVDPVVCQGEIPTVPSRTIDVGPFPWPPGMLHLLSLLQDGFGGRSASLPLEVRILVDKLVFSATEKGMPLDQKWALEAAGTATDPILKHLISAAFASKSQWLGEVAYRQVARLTIIPKDISAGIRGAIVGLADRGRLYRERYATTAHLKRIERIAGQRHYLSIMDLLLWKDLMCDSFS